MQMRIGGCCTGLLFLLYYYTCNSLVLGPKTYSLQTLFDSACPVCTCFHLCVYASSPCVSVSFSFPSFLTLPLSLSMFLYVLFLFLAFSSSSCHFLCPSLSLCSFFMSLILSLFLSVFTSLLPLSSFILVVSARLRHHRKSASFVRASRGSDLLMTGVKAIATLAAVAVVSYLC